MERYLTPIPPQLPQPNSQVNIRCCHCKHFPVCGMRQDYLKTAFLIEEILGWPQDQYEISCNCGDNLIGFKGWRFDNNNLIFPKAIKFVDITEMATFEDAKFRNKNTVQFIYKLYNYYILLFNAFWSEEKEEFLIKEGHEIRYNTIVELEEEEKNKIKEKLKEWRGEFKEEDKEFDVVNTTHFSTLLNCDFYEWDKEHEINCGFDRMFLKTKFGDTSHLATYHIEDRKIPLYRKRPAGFYPMPFPWPQNCCKPKKKYSVKRKNCE